MIPLAERNDGASDPRASRRDSLYQRLEVGYDKIERGLAEGRDMSSWEDFWADLLREYERVCDELAGEPLAA